MDVTEPSDYQRQRSKMDIEFLVGTTNQPNCAILSNYISDQTAHRSSNEPATPPQSNETANQREQGTSMFLPYLSDGKMAWSRADCRNAPSTGSSFETLSSTNERHDQKQVSSSRHRASPIDVLESPGFSKRLILTSKESHPSLERSKPDESLRSTVELQSKAPPKTTRAPRPSYTQGQKFFIMYCRIVKRLVWKDIEDQFANTFDLRTKDGLTSVYYRIRREWGLGMAQGLAVSTGSGNTALDEMKVAEMATRFSPDFLESFGYSIGHQGWEFP